MKAQTSEFQLETKILLSVSSTALSYKRLLSSSVSLSKNNIDMARISFPGMATFTPRSSRAGTPVGSRSRTPSPSALSLKKLRLRIHAGPSYDRATHVNVNVNDPSEPTFIDSENFTGHIVVRVRDYAGVAGKNGVIGEDEEYFSETKDTCSIMFGGWFKNQGEQWSVDDIVFGVYLSRMN